MMHILASKLGIFHFEGGMPFLKKNCAMFLSVSIQDFSVFVSGRWSYKYTYFLVFSPSVLIVSLTSFGR